MKKSFFIFGILALSMSAAAQLRVLNSGHIVAGDYPAIDKVALLTGSNIECDKDGSILLDSDVVIEKGAVFTVK